MRHTACTSVPGVITAVLLLQSLGVSAWSQVVRKVEPPNWWTVERPMPLTLLITGEGLDAAKVSTTAPGIAIGATRVSANGNHLFCDLVVEPSAVAGEIPLQVQTQSGTARVAWSLLDRAAMEPGHAGLAADDVIYFLMIDRFANGEPGNDEPDPAHRTLDRKNPKAYHGGDLRGVIEQLDAIQALGATAVWLTPIYQNEDTVGTSYHGYGATDFYAVEEHFGTMADYQELARQLHRRGMKLIQDTVPNHTGPTHPWVKDPPTPTWFHGTPERHLNCSFDLPVGADPKATREKRAELLEGWFANTLPDLNGRDAEYRRYAIQNTLWWNMISGQDALRLDTYPYVDRSFWKAWQQAQDEHFPRMLQIGEVWHGDPAVISFWRGGRKGWDGIDTGLKSQFDFPLLYAIRDFACRDAGAERLTGLLERDPLYGNASRNVTFIGNHDIKRILREAGGNADRVRLAFSLLFTLRGIPQVYAGDEIGMDGDEDPDNRRDYPGGWGERKSAFEARGRTRAQREMWDEVARLIRIRREHPALQDGSFTPVLVQGRTLAFVRQKDDDRVLVVIHGLDKPARVKLEPSDVLPEGAVLKPIEEKGPAIKMRRAGTAVQVPGMGCRIFEMQQPDGGG